LPEVGEYRIYTKYIGAKKPLNDQGVFVVWGGIEPPTQGFSVLKSLVSNGLT
jgi:hypothetical protein